MREHGSRPTARQMMQDLARQQARRVLWATVVGWLAVTLVGAWVVAYAWGVMG